MIIGGRLRLQVLFKNDYETFPNYRPKATRGCAAQPRAHPGSGEAGIHSVGCKYQPGGDRQQAGVGPGTLYRHFPTREELLQAVYQSEVEKLAAAARKFAQTMPPTEALRAWLLLFVDAIATKQIIAPALNALIGDPKKVFEASYAQIHDAIRALVKRAVKSGDIRKDLDPIDLLRALVGVANVATSPDWQQSARRLVDILVIGSRPFK